MWRPERGVAGEMTSEFLAIDASCVLVVPAPTSSRTTEDSVTKFNNRLEHTSANKFLNDENVGDCRNRCSEHLFSRNILRRRRRRLTEILVFPRFV